MWCHCEEGLQVLPCNEMQSKGKSLLCGGATSVECPSQAAFLLPLEQEVTLGSSLLP